MMKQKRMTAILLTAAVIGLLLTGCFGADAPESSEEPSVPPAVSEESSVPEPSVAESTDSEDVSELPENAVREITLSKYEVSVPVGGSDMPIVTMLPAEAEDKGEIWMSSDTAVATVDDLGNITGVDAGECTVTVTSHQNPSVSAAVAVTVYARTSVENATYIDGILIANKTYALPADYNPGVDPDAQAALDVMFAHAYDEGVTLWVCSGFRSYDTQARIYDRYVSQDGQAAADRYSARPGHSEHQTGLAFDINCADDSFIGTKEAIWLAENAWKYGFIIRYPQDKESETGYKYEPWHVRYLGEDVAAAVQESGLCLEEYLGITSVYGD